jgi:4-hydroxymandelate oxidase
VAEWAIGPSPWQPAAGQEPKRDQPFSLEAYCVGEVEAAAADVLPGEIWEFISGGSGCERTLEANRVAFDRVFLTPRVLRDVSACSAAGTLLGRPAALPLALAPVAYHRLVHPEGELAAARVARDAGVPFIVGTLSSVPVEQVTAVGGQVWFQLYWLRDRKRTFELVRRAEDAGCHAIVLTVDVPWMGRRLRDMRNGFRLPESVRAVHLADPNGAQTTTAHHGTEHGSAVAAHTAQEFSASVTWSDLESLRAATSLPLVVKGILAAEDARRAVAAGADAIVVSNHGGRQLDGALPSLDALPGVVAAVSGDCEILLDSGVRSGTDILKALALGARGVLIGRPFLWGLAAGGEQGARLVLDLLAGELADALGLAGCASPLEAAELAVTAYPPTLPGYPAR